MPKQNIDELTDFGKRLVTLRKQAGYTQTELANELDVSQRMVSHYEGHTEYPPAALLPKLAALLNVTSDELLGLEPLKKNRQPDTRLQRRFQQIEKLPNKEKRKLVQVIDTFLKAAQLSESTTHQ
ncbi:helix-turn-helix transcriptional regulator [Ketobacter sp. MCCC 1A13808]|uniref:helix-turn-helix domain-containing protein n=1 Tax=Ketobacter sp. MCCC 1A13808 TaxID=2602738 RepID=UPI0012EB31EC|nr:helix-turn-helix transcriptional regulator [Ketobacter sp. MCCC 1A13808]MVF14317.1 helix-turn-helix transcriptional regulator [Ketobacter sp. MCCC 1A13808]